MAIQIDEGKSELSRHGHGHLVLCGQTHFNDHAAQLLAGLALLVEGFLELLLVDQTLVN